MNFVLKFNLKGCIVFMEHNALRLGSYLVGDSFSTDYQIPTFFLFSLKQRYFSKNYSRSQTMRTFIKLLAVLTLIIAGFSQHTTASALAGPVFIYPIDGQTLD